MFQPTFPVISPEITRETVLNMILASIAMEELELSHNINAEGEKLEFILGILPNGKESKTTIDEVLAVNESVRRLLDSVIQNSFFSKIHDGEF